MVDDKHRSTLNPHTVPVTMWRPPDRKNGKAYVSTYSRYGCFSVGYVFRAPRDWPGAQAENRRKKEEEKKKKRDVAPPWSRVSRGEEFFFFPPPFWPLTLDMIDTSATGNYIGT